MLAPVCVRGIERATASTTGKARATAFAGGGFLMAAIRFTDHQIEQIIPTLRKDLPPGA
jgi:hypothetical protein